MLVGYVSDERYVALHDVARDCTVVDCEEVTNVNA